MLFSSIILCTANMNLDNDDFTVLRVYYLTIKIQKHFHIAGEHAH